jgi:hypothetical protein
VSRLGVYDEPQVPLSRPGRRRVEAIEHDPQSGVHVLEDLAELFGGVGRGLLVNGYHAASISQRCDDAKGDVATSQQLVCAECGRQDPGVEPGWTLRLDIDYELVAFCPECDRKEFGDSCRS